MAKGKGQIGKIPQRSQCGSSLSLYGTPTAGEGRGQQPDGKQPSTVYRKRKANDLNIQGKTQPFLCKDNENLNAVTHCFFSSGQRV